MNPAAADAPVCFAVKRGEVQRRFDANFHLPGAKRAEQAIRKLKHTSLRSLTALCYRYPGFYGIEYHESGIRVLKGENITRDGEWRETNAADFITHEVNEKFPLTQLEEGDLVMSVRGEVGKVACVTRELAGSNLNANTIRISLRDEAKRKVITPAFVWMFLNSVVGQRLIKRAIAGGVQETITAPEILDVLIPTPKLDIQRKLVAEMQAAREARKQKLREADELLAGLDAYLLETLGLTPPARSFRLAYAVRLKDARRRFDPDFHSAKFRAIRESIDHGRHPAESVLTLCSSIQSGFAAGKHDQAFDLETGVPHLRPLNLNIYGELSLVGTKFVPKASVSASDLCVPGEVLFNNTNSTELVGKSAVFDLAEPCACSNHITRLRVRTDLNAHYLATVFNALRSIGYLGLLSTNFNNQAGINIDTLSELRLPVPPKGLQQQIATEVRRRREQARRLRGEAEADWQGAKRRFEQQLLGTEQQ